MLKIIIKIVTIILVLAALFVSVLWLFGCEMVWNRSESLPIHFVIIKNGVQPSKLDQIIVFKVRENPHYKMKEMSFIKLVGGMSGDEIELNGGEVFFDGKKSPSNSQLFNIFEAINLLKLTDPEELKKRKITFTEREAFVSGRKIGIVKPFTKKFENFTKNSENNNTEFDDEKYELHPIEAGRIPAHKFFVYTPHKDSFDSRYKEIGLIDEKDIIGTAVFAF